VLVKRDWSGNIRELRNVVERLVIMSNDAVIESAEVETLSLPKGSATDDLIRSSQSFQEFKDKSEAAFILHQLKLHGWNVSKTAEALGMERSHLYTKIKKYELEREGKGGEEDEGEKS